MKNQFIYLLLAGFTFIACEKVREPHVTSFQLEINDYFTGDSIPNQEFFLQGFNTSQYDFVAYTNAYGRFDTMFVHEAESDFKCVPNNFSTHYLAYSSGNVKNGKNTAVVVETIPYGNLSYHFDCSGSGSATIRNVKREMIFPSEPTDEMLYSEGGKTTIATYINCGAYSSYQLAFSGNWIISYEKQNTTSSPWLPYSDTITIAPGEYYTHTILY